MNSIITFKVLKSILSKDCVFLGNKELIFKGVNSIYESNIGEISWIKQGVKDEDKLINLSKASCIVCSRETYNKYNQDLKDKLFVISKDPKYNFVKILNYLEVQNNNSNNEFLIHPTAIIDVNCKIGKNVKIGPYSVIGNCTIGDNTIISEFVKIFDCVEIGKNCIIRENVTIGGKGLGYIKNEKNELLQVPHFGKVVIKDNVHIFPFVNIDQGTLGLTIIGKGSKIDHHVHIAHNSSVGENSILVCGTVMAGGSKVSDNCFIGGNTQIKQKCVIGNRVITGMGAVVIKDIPDDEVWIGNPAKFLKKTPEQIF